MTDTAQWVVWNGSLGVVDMATIGRIEHGENGRRAWLAPPYDVVGPFSLDELDTEGRIAFGACLVMSRQRWREDQAGLRSEARKARRALLQRANGDDDSEFREALALPLEGVLTASEIKAAFRQKAKTAHPDGGGSSALYRRITAARDALLSQCEKAPI
ncbi:MULTISPECIES: J domain-containing protein [unclassified Bradyrhizobium]|uniref:J domain-containing protein n=1 Tax=unclassified Bradyrhizobium TaxID=2631580 RepID=UPI0028EE96EC|nr:MULTISPECIES: J domain-containing protein [unclassified Bradyrhizobium]